MRCMNSSNLTITEITYRFDVGLAISCAEIHFEDEEGGGGGWRKKETFSCLVNLVVVPVLETENNIVKKVHAKQYVRVPG